MNVSAVLFVGLSKREETIHWHQNTGQNPANDITAIYNFELNRWQQQDSLYFNRSQNMIAEYSYELTCSILHDKTGNR